MLTFLIVAFYVGIFGLIGWTALMLLLLAALWWNK